MYEFEKTRIVFAFDELCKAAQNEAAYNLAIDALQFGGMAWCCLDEDTDSAKHAADELRMRVTFDRSAEWDTIPDIECSVFCPSWNSVNVDNISNGYWIGEGVKDRVMCHADALKHAETIADKFSEKSNYASYNAEYLEREFYAMYKCAYSDAREFADSSENIVSCDIERQISAIERAHEKATRLEKLADAANETFERMYTRIMTDALTKAYEEIAYEYNYFFNPDYWSEWFKDSDPENVPLFDDYGTISEYTLKDAKNLNAA